jgi:acetyl esterase/lipase
MNVTTWIDPELGEVVARFGLQPPPLGNDPLGMLRRMGTTYDRPAPDGIGRVDLTVPGRDGDPDVPIRVIRNTGGHRPTAAILWFHGGGYVTGGHELETRRLERLVARIGCVAVAVGYRLAPETPYPGPVDDCFAALSYVSANAAGLGVDAERIAVGGESAGGGLAAAVAIPARDHGVPLAHQHLIQPMLDDRMLTASSSWTVPIWSNEIAAFGWRSYLGELYGTDEIPPTAAPGRAESLAGLAPAYMHVGALDIVLHENVEYALRLTAAGVPTELHMFPGAPHGFEDLAPKATISRRARELSTDALQRHLGLGDSS